MQTWAPSNRCSATSLAKPALGFAKPPARFLTSIRHCPWHRSAPTKVLIHESSLRCAVEPCSKFGVDTDVVPVTLGTAATKVRDRSRRSWELRATGISRQGTAVFPIADSFDCAESMRSVRHSASSKRRLRHRWTLRASLVLADGVAMSPFEHSSRSTPTSVHCECVTPIALHQEPLTPLAFWYPNPARQQTGRSGPQHQCSPFTPTFRSRYRR